jgi:hypothetical protein
LAISVSVFPSARSCRARSRTSCGIGFGIINQYRGYNRIHDEEACMLTTIIVTALIIDGLLIGLYVGHRLAHGKTPRP